MNCDQLRRMKTRKNPGNCGIPRVSEEKRYPVRDSNFLAYPIEQTETDRDLGTVYGTVNYGDKQADEMDKRQYRRHERQLQAS